MNKYLTQFVTTGFLQEHPWKCPSSALNTTSLHVASKV